MRRVHTWITIGLLVCATSLAWAESPLNPKISLRDNLNALMNAKKPVTLLLKNGTTYRAAIGSVGDQYVVLTGPQQKEFFDVLVALDEIAAVEAKARDQ